MPGLWKVDCYLCFHHKELDRKKMHRPCAFSLGHHLFKMLENGQRSETRCPQLHARCSHSATQFLCVKFLAYLWEHTPLLNYKSFSPQEWKNVTSKRTSYLYEPWLASAFLVRIALVGQTIVFHIITHICFVGAVDTCLFSYLETFIFINIFNIISILLTVKIKYYTIFIRNYSFYGYL